MAYGNGGSNQQGGFNKGKYGSQAKAPMAANAGQRKEFKEDPNELGIGYQKDLKSGGTYITFTVTKDIAAGTKVAVFANDKVKNRTEKTPTHKLKLSVRKQA